VISVIRAGAFREAYKKHSPYPPIPVPIRMVQHGADGSDIAEELADEVGPGSRVFHVRSAQVFWDDVIIAQAQHGVDALDGLMEGVALFAVT